MSSNVAKPMLQTFRRVSALFCAFLSLVPAYFLLRGELSVGSSTSARGLQRMVRYEESPTEFVLALLLVLAMLGAAWFLRTFLLRELAKPLPPEA